jgi:hypothetical protein
MNDKELLEFAAKAAGVEDEMLVFGWWNPLTDDGDALRLAVKLSFDIHVDSNLTEVIYLNETTEAHLGDPYSATRRAIVRAAAEIGKAKAN